MAGASRADRIARILALEIDRMLRQLDDRRAFLLQMWSRHRAREPLLDTLFSRYRTLSAGDLAELDAEVIDALEAFYELHGELVAYARFTEDMPTTLEERLDELTEALRESGEAALDALGPAVAAPGPPRLVWADDEPDEG